MGLDKTLSLIALILVIVAIINLTIENGQLKEENTQLKEEKTRLLPSLGLYINDKMAEPSEIWVRYKGNPFGICYGVPTTNNTWKMACGKNITISTENESGELFQKDEITKPDEYTYYENYWKRSEEKVYECEKLVGKNRSESDRCWFIGWR